MSCGCRKTPCCCPTPSFVEQAEAAAASAAASAAMVLNALRISPQPDNCLEQLPDGLYVPCGTLTFDDTPSIDLTLTGLSVTGDVKISADANNAFEIHADGAYVPQVTALGLAVNDTNTVDLTLLAGPTIEADVVISPDANNCLVALVNGLFVACPCVTDTTSINFSIDGGGCITGSVLISSDANNGLSVHLDGLYSINNSTSILDSTSIDLTISAGPNQILTAVAIISPDVNNGLSIHANGLYSINNSTSVVDSTSIDLAISAGPNQILMAAVIISPDANNALVSLANGLFVDENILTVTDSTSIDLTITGSAPQDITAAVIVSGNANNALTSIASGLFVAQNLLTVTDSSSINLTITGTAPQDVTAAVIVSPDSFNLLESHANGLWVPASDGWIPFNATLTFVSANSFSLVGDWTDRITFGDRIKLTDGAVEYYAVINRVFALGITTVTITAGTDNTLSGGAITNGFFSHDASVVGYPSFFNYTPTYASVVGTWTIVTTNLARFRVIGRAVFVKIEAVGTTGGNPSALTATLPITSTETMGPFACFVENGVGVTLAGIGRFNSATVIQGQRYDIANFSNGVGRMLSIAGEYRFA